MAKANQRGAIRITEETISKAVENLHQLLTTHSVAIGQAYINCENELSVSLGVKFQPSKGAGDVDMISSISFTESKIKDSIKTTLDPNQKPLFQGMKPAIAR